MNEDESWKLQKKLIKARWKEVWWYSPLSREWQIRKEFGDIEASDRLEDVDVDPPDEYNRDEHSHIIEEGDS
jgi:hypothetical protein